MKVLEFVYEMVADVCISETDKAVHTALGRLLHGAWVVVFQFVVSLMISSQV